MLLSAVCSIWLVVVDEIGRTFGISEKAKALQLSSMSSIMVKGK